MDTTEHDEEADVEASVLRIAAALEREAERLEGTFRVIASHFRSEASRLRRLTG